MIPLTTSLSSMMIIPSITSLRIELQEMIQASLRNTLIYVPINSKEKKCYDDDDDDDNKCAVECKRVIECDYSCDTDR